MTRNINFAPGEFYHIYNRGTDKRIIFSRVGDYARFQVLLHLCNSDTPVDISDQIRQGRTLPELYELEKGNPIVAIGSYCLMPNHFHILISEIKDGGISAFMQKLQTAYTMYFNKKYDRTGSLFQGKFKAKHLNNDEYLKYIFAYINLNPVKIIDHTWKENGIKNLSKAKDYLEQYIFSSYTDLLKISRTESKILAMNMFPEYFSERVTFKDFINEWLNIKSLLSDSDQVL